MTLLYKEGYILTVVVLLTVEKYSFEYTAKANHEWIKDLIYLLQNSFTYI